MDPHFNLPHRKKMGLEIDRLYDNLKSVIMSSLQGANSISICTDIWSKPGFTASFLGVTAHYFSHQDKQRHNVTLAVSRLPPPHNAVKIFNALNLVLEQWSILKDRVFRILTDNGSNMVVAFKIHAPGNESNEEDFADHVALEDDLHLQAAQESDNEWSDVYDSEPLPENDAIAEITDFEHHEFNHDSVFTTS